MSEYPSSQPRSFVSELARALVPRFLSPLEIAFFDEPASKVYGTIRAALEKKGRPIGPMDLLIAAHALSLDVRLVTNNARQFERVSGLEIDNWA
jgi:tRNA(fMet)-specific endonuclease VapC